MRKARILLIVMNDDDDDDRRRPTPPPARRGGAPRPIATVRQFFRARNAPRGTREITSSGSAKLWDGERTRLIRSKERERERKRLQRVDTTHEGGTVLLGNGYFVDDSVVAVGINVGLPKHRETRASVNCAWP